MAKIVVLGAGVMGSAFAQMIADSGHDVSLVGTHLDGNIISALRDGKAHPNLNFKLSNRMAASYLHELKDTLESYTDLIILGVSSAGVEWAIHQIGKTLPKTTPILLLTKGLAVHKRSLRILPEVVREGLAVYGFKGLIVGAIGGPCIASELAARRSTSVVVALPDGSMLESIIRLFSAPYYHARGSADLIGVEACAALKNLYAIGIAFPAGQLEAGFKAENEAKVHNLCAGLFTQALVEMQYIVSWMGGHPSSVYGLAGSGDLYVTCQAGRNSRMGKLLGAGVRYSEAKSQKMSDETVEGADLALTIAPAINFLLQKGSLKESALPFMISILNAICSDKPTSLPWHLFYRSSIRQASAQPQ